MSAGACGRFKWRASKNRAKPGDVLFSLSQRRQMNLERVDAEEEILAEGPFSHHVLQVAVGGADDPDVDVEGFVLAHSPDFARFEEP